MTQDKVYCRGECVMLTSRIKICAYLQPLVPSFRLIAANRQSFCPPLLRSPFLSPASRSMAGGNPEKRVTRSATRAAAIPSAEPELPLNAATSAVDASVNSSTAGSELPRKRKAADRQRRVTKKVSKNGNDASVKDNDEVLVNSKSTEMKNAAKVETTGHAGKGKKETSSVGTDTIDEIVETTCNVKWGACAQELIKIVTWNISSCRALLKNGALMDYINRDHPDILLLQETKMTSASMKDFPELETHNVHWNNSTAKKGYSGVAIITSKQLLERKGLSVVSVTPGMGNEEADAEGRVLTLVLSNDTAIVNAYVPNSGGKLARLSYRTQNFEPEMRIFLDKLKQTHRRVVYSGDLNVAHHPIDIHNSKGNLKSAGHTPQERAEFSNLLAEGWIDVFRHMYPNKRAYTYFSKRFGERMKTENKGWRLDYHVISKFEEGEIKDCYIRYDQSGSDHLPTVLLLKYEQEP